MIESQEIEKNCQLLGLAEDLRILAQARKQDAAVSIIDKASAEFSKSHFTLAVLGMVKRGKSTFCNAVLGAKDDRYAPVGRTPVSSAISLFKKDAVERGVTVSFNDGRVESIQIDRIADYTTEQCNPKNIKGVREIVVKDDFQNLPEGIALVDTPGEGSFNAHHDELLYRYLPSVDAAIFLITAYSPLVQSEIDFLKELQSKDVRKIFFAMNRADQPDEVELNDAIEHNRSVLSANGIAVSKIYPISAKKALAGDWQGSGIGVLLDDVFSTLLGIRFLEPRRRFLNRIAPVVAPLANGISEELAAQEKSAAELQAEIDRLTKQGNDTEADQQKRLHDIEEGWDRAERMLRSDVDSMLDAAEEELQKWINGITVFNVLNVKRDFSGVFEKVIQTGELRCMASFDAAINKLVSDYYSGESVQDMVGSADGGQFMQGTSCGYGKFALNAVLTAVGIANIVTVPLIAVFGSFMWWHTLKSAKDDLSTQLPTAIAKIKEKWRKLSLAKGKEDLMSSLNAAYQLELQPTLDALGDALRMKEEGDPQYIETLKTQLSVISNVQKSVDAHIAEIGA